jgi:CheY-like chemotaxis protein
MIVRVPCARASSALRVAPHDEPTTPQRDATRRVLVVDDNPDAVKTLAEALTIAGHVVRTAGDGPSALQVVATFVPDIVFLDIGLPAMDGYELASLLRKVPHLAHTPLVAITGYAQDDDRQRALESGFSEHLAKPLDFGRLLECIDSFAPQSDGGSGELAGLAS